MSTPTKPPVPYAAISAAYVAWMTAKRALSSAANAEADAHSALDSLVFAHLGVGRKTIVDMGPARAGADAAAEVGGTYLLVSVVQLATGPQVQIEIVKK